MKRALILFLFLIFPLLSFSEEPSFIEKEKRMALAFKNKKNFLSAVSDVLAKNPEHLKALNYLGLYHLRRGQTAMAHIVFDRALAVRSGSARLHNNKGLAFLKEKKKQEAAIAFERSLKLNDDYFPALVNLSSLYMEAGNSRRALPLLERAHGLLKEKRASGPYSKIASNYGLALIQTGNMDKARALYRTLYKRDQMLLEALVGYAIILMDEFKDDKEALNVLKQADFKVKTSQDKKRISRLKNKVKKIRERKNAKK